MNILFFSLMFSEKSLLEAFRFSKCGVQMATHIFQWNLMEGLQSFDNVDLRIMNVPPVGCFPKNNSKVILLNRKWEEKNNEIGFINIPFIKQITQTNALIRNAERFLMNTSECTILIYSLYEPFLRSANILRTYPKIIFDELE